jgi:hypothetical protein
MSKRFIGYPEPVDPDWDVEYEFEIRSDIQKQFAMNMEVKREQLLEYRLVNALLGRKTYR